MHSPVEMVAARRRAQHRAAAARRSRRRLTPRRVRSADDASAPAAVGTSTARCCSAPRSSTPGARRGGAGGPRRRPICSRHAVEAAGRTDCAIARDAAARRGVGAGGDRRARPARCCARRSTAYEELCPPDLSARLAPGIVELLDALRRAGRRFRLSLVTGNFEPVARLKLARAGIGDHFPAGQGGFGSDHRGAPSCRRSPAPGADPPWPRERTVVIGDTPRDIACARADARARRRPSPPARSPSRRWPTPTRSPTTPARCSRCSPTGPEVQPQFAPGRGPRPQSPAARRTMAAASAAARARSRPPSTASDRHVWKSTAWRVAASSIARSGSGRPSASARAASSR